MEFEIIYLDNHLLVINKPAGMLSQADHTGDPDVVTLGKAYLKSHFDRPGKVFLGLVQRLDRPASGLMVLARTSKAAKRLGKQFQEKSVIKRYLAIVVGDRRGEGECIDFLLKENRQVRVVDAAHPAGKRAELRWRARARAHGLTLLDIRLLTGRPHQIRVQMAHAGFPLLGDFRYGVQKIFEGKNLALHCYHIEVEHPIRHDRMAWHLAPPAVWETFFPKHVLATSNDSGR